MVGGCCSHHGLSFFNEVLMLAMALLKTIRGARLPDNELEAMLTIVMGAVPHTRLEDEGGCFRVLQSALKCQGQGSLT